MITKSDTKLTSLDQLKIHRNQIILIIILTGLLLVGCGSNHNQAVQTVEKYFQAITAKDESLLLSKTCNQYETIALMDFNAFAFVDTTLENLDCSILDESNDSIHVKCQGNLIADFGGESRSFDLSRRTYQLMEQNGGWLICGHTDE